MAFFERKRKGIRNSIVKVADINVVACEIVSSYNDRDSGSPCSVTMYFLAKCIDNEYYELFSGKKLEKEKKPEDGVLSLSFDIPYIKKEEPLKKYLRNQNEVTIDTHSLFDFITNMNVLGILGAYEEQSKEC